MQRICLGFLIVILAASTACNTNKKKEQSPAPFLSAKETVLLSQLVYKDTIKEAFAGYAPEYEIVFLPKSIGGNLAVIVKNKNANQYAVVIRGSLIEFSNAGFQNFFLQDFNIFTNKPWNYADTVKEANISLGAFTGFQNLLQLRDITTGLSIKEFIEQKIAVNSSIVITGHSLGGNLAYPFAGYLKKELPPEKKNILQLITFGAPAVGNAAFVQDLEEKFPTAERYVTDKDIAPVFPDMDRMNDLAKLTGLDSVLQLSKLNINGIAGKLNAADLLNIAGEILEKANVINKTNKYVQSQKHLRLLTTNSPASSNTPASVDAIFDRAYQFHKIDTYAVLLGGKSIE
jgi:hypothetical protein